MIGRIEDEWDASVTVLTRVGLALRAKGYTVSLNTVDEDGNKRLSLTYYAQHPKQTRTITVDRRERRGSSGDYVEVVMQSGATHMPYRRMFSDAICDGFLRTEIDALVEDLVNDVIWCCGTYVSRSAADTTVTKTKGRRP